MAVVAMLPQFKDSQHGGTDDHGHHAGGSRQFDCGGVREF
jgi:hypothetical protein